ncbi:PREDICTED: TMV resistance protein N-like isoform X2 [Nelumbo nucifera]|uniref:TMV resistance protein N-like isoform X2 n=1 Tax=Nelumbo nucifera TaxID=4432 RepID=A0A1U8Q347_NELNU|nr:PREDICTED: TMV resistance protein N-like isoform X2 [Nelumbo nucifera]
MGTEEDSSSSSSSSSTSSSSDEWNYDVFLSFRGEDTRKNFTEYLYTALVKKGIHTFRDDKELQRGEEISPALLKAIEESRICIIIFSKNYASSRWCLDELCKILECRGKKRKIGRTIVMPVFYDIDPSDVRKQTGSFAEAFASHEKRFEFNTEMMEKVKRWRSALTEAANLSGWDLRYLAKGHEAKFVHKIVEEVFTKLIQMQMKVATHLVGLDSRVEKMTSLLSVGSHDVRFVGIWGMGGIGKTTIAKAIYSLIFHRFEGCSFLHDIRDISEEPNGLVRLQEQLLSDILMVSKENIRISTLDRGVNLIKEKLSCKRVLVVLDNVDQLNQLDALARARDWFGMGSRVIITTRDEHLLNELRVDTVYKVRKLDKEESLELFSWHTFRKDHPISEYEELARNIVSCLGGLPLALQVLGSFLGEYRSIPEWRSALEKLKRIPNKDIQKQLRLSFDALDENEKDIFLDIACFFIRIEKEDVVTVLDSCGFFSEIGISVLARRSLLIIDEKNELRMHDLVRDMGREIVREEAPKEPEERSRLWYHEDAFQVLTKHTGTRKVEGLALNFPKWEETHVGAKAFAKMHNLRLLKVNYVNIEGGFEYLPKELRWLYWFGFPLRSIPMEFNLQNLVVLDMQYSRIKKVWTETKLLEKLKVLNLSHSHDLIRTPNFSGIPNLERLILEDCLNLVEVHDSIGALDRLIYLNLKDCSKLRSLPSSICKLRSLENLILSGCSRSVQSPPKSWHSFFFWPWGSLSKHSNSTKLLPASLSGLCSLKTLNLRNCNLSEGSIPNDIGNLSSLLLLDLSKNNFSSLPASINCLFKLKVLFLQNCKRLQSLPELPSSLRVFNADDCTSLERLSNMGNLSSLEGLSLSRTNIHTLPVDISHLSQLQELWLRNCTRIQSLLFLPSALKSLYVDGCTSLETLSNLSHLQNISVLTLANCNKLWLSSHSGIFDIFLPGSDVPEWFSNQNIGSSIYLEVPALSDCRLQEFLVLAVYTGDRATNENVFGPRIKIINETSGLKWSYESTIYFVSTTSQDQVWMCRIPRTVFENVFEVGDRLIVKVKIGIPLWVKKCGVHLVYNTDHEEDSQLKDQRMVQYTWKKRHNDYDARSNCDSKRLRLT